MPAVEELSRKRQCFHEHWFTVVHEFIKTATLQSLIIKNTYNLYIFVFGQVDKSDQRPDFIKKYCLKLFKLFKIEKRPLLISFVYDFEQVVKYFFSIFDNWSLLFS